MDFENKLSAQVLNICFGIHKQYGPGLLESVYERILCYELGKMNLEYEVQCPINVIHEGMDMDLGFRADIIVEEAVLIELKSVKKLEDVHYKQVLTYLKIANLKLGLLINFNETLLKNGIKRVINNPL